MRVRLATCPPFCVFHLSPTKVSRLDAKIEGDMAREKMKSDATAKATAAGAEQEANSLRASLRAAEAELAASRGRERQAADAASAPLKAELAAARDAARRAEEALAAALQRARAAEAAAERAAQAARQDKDTLKRGLVASQTACAELRAERSKLLSELEQAASSAAVAAATAFSSPSDPGDGDGASAGGFSVRAADAAGALGARSDLEGRLARALAEAAEARSDAQRLKERLKACDREQRTMTLGGVDREGLEEALGESCRVMRRVATALSAAADDGAGGAPRSGGGGSALDDPRWATRGGRSRRRGGGASGGRHRSLAEGAAPRTQGSRRRRNGRRRRAFSADSHRSGSGLGDDGYRDHHRDDGDGGSGNSSGSGGEGGTSDDEARRVVSPAEVREVSERLRFQASRLLDTRMEEQRLAEDKVTRLRQDLRDSEGREAEVAARLEESREVSGAGGELVENRCPFGALPMAVLYSVDSLALQDNLGFVPSGPCSDGH